MLERLPVETQALYAEFLDQLVALHARRTIGLVPGCFTTKTIKGGDEPPLTFPPPIHS